MITERMQELGGVNEAANKEKIKKRKAELRSAAKYGNGKSTVWAMANRYDAIARYPVSKNSTMGEIIKAIIDIEFGGKS